MTSRKFSRQKFAPEILPLQNLDFLQFHLEDPNLRPKYITVDQTPNHLTEFLQFFCLQTP